MKILNCVDCGEETECEWCDVCTRPVCDDCDLSHDCMAEHLTEDDEDSEDEELSDDDCPEDDEEFSSDDDDSACGSA